MFNNTIKGVLRMNRNLRIMKYYLALSLPFMLGPVLHAFYDARGLLVSDYYILFAVSLGSAFLFELPTGVIADRVGYKHSLLLGSLFSFISISMMIYSTNLYHFLIAEVIFGFGASFISGADSGLVYDSLMVLKRETEYGEVYGKSRQFVFVAAGVGSLVSSMLFKVNDTLPFAINSVFILISFVLILFIKEPLSTKEKSESYRKQLKSVRRHIFRTKKIWAVILLSSVVFIFYRPSINLYRPFLKAVEVDVFYYGLIFLGLNVVAHFASKRVSLYYKLTNGFPLLGLVFVMIITLLLLSVPILWVGLLGMGVNQIVRGIYKPVVSTYVNELTTSEVRATTLSYVSLINQVAAGLGALVFSLFVNNYSSFDYVLILATALAVLGTVIYIFIYKRYGIR